jgi:hypothetical protein
VAKVVANPEVDSSGKLAEDEIEIDDEISDASDGWRLEKNSNGYYRWRWQMKDEDGQPVTYTTASGNTGYKRGSKYVGKKE